MEGRKDAEDLGSSAETGGESAALAAGALGSGTVKKVLLSPFTGEAVPITEAADEAFAGKMMGDGYIVRPGEGMACAPEDATVSFVFPSKHAVGLMGDDGTEYLLHIGVDTVNLNGEGFETYVKDGDRVKKGDKLIAFDIEYIREHAKSDECIIVFTSLKEGEEIRLTKPGKVAKLTRQRRLSLLTEAESLSLLSAAEAAGAGDFVTARKKMMRAGQKRLWRAGQRRLRHAVGRMEHAVGRMERAAAGRNAFAGTGQMGETYVSDYKKY